jgi:signal transduction histidine kinase
LKKKSPKRKRMITSEENIANLEKLNTLKKIITEDELERLNISYILNENIAQMLAAVNLHINLAKKKNTFEEVIYIEEAEAILKSTLDEVKLLASSISPMDLKNIGFTTLLEDVIAILDVHHEIKSNVKIDENLILKTSITNRNILFQIAQLQIINILKCSSVQEVFVTIETHNDFVRLTIKDNGFRNIKHNNSLNESLVQLKLRVEAFDGSFTITEQSTEELFYTLEVCL